MTDQSRYVLTFTQIDDKVTVYLNQSSDPVFENGLLRHGQPEQTKDITDDVQPGTNTLRLVLWNGQSSYTLKGTLTKDGEAPPLHTWDISGGQQLKANVHDDVYSFEGPPATMVDAGAPKLEHADLGGGAGEEAILGMVSAEMLATIQAQGMPIHGGNNPPNAEGTYLLNTFSLKSSLVPGDTVGKGFSDLTLTLADQIDHKVTVSYVNGGERADGLGSFIVGSGKEFTIGAELNVTYSDAPAKIIVLISGSLEDNGIKDGHWANFMIDNHGRNDIYIANGTGRVIIDNDGFSEKTA